ncbi:DUF883 domain-containing protein [Stutzerimonas urumqiensis]|uniref:DUF883 family protein n=1 Tax=Stutzerimonas urumqiensis TaxID=638269 RepID=UPI000EB5A2A5|nr:DUF883 family protein [Stutzerimonas urumqiensis]
MSRFARKTTTREEIQAEIDSLMHALDDLKRDAMRGSRHRLDHLGDRVASLWNERHFDDHYADLSRHTVAAGRMAKDCVRRHPWSTVALAAGACALIGYLATRR